MDGREAGVATGKVWKPDGRHTESGQDMAAGASNHERVSSIQALYKLNTLSRRNTLQNKTQQPISDPTIDKMILQQEAFEQVALLWQRDRATRLSVEILQLQNIPIVWHYFA